VKQEITNFINQTRNLKSLEAVTYLLQFDAEKNNREHDLQNLKNIFVAIQSANEHLLKALYFHLFSSLEEFQQLQISFPTLVEKDIAEAIKNVESTTTESIPHKEELLTLLKSHAAIFNEKSMLDLFKHLEENETEYHDQILLLEELCDQQQAY
jgi:hypothetical protein